MKKKKIRKTEVFTLQNSAWKLGVVPGEWVQLFLIIKFSERVFFTETRICILKSKALLKQKGLSDLLELYKRDSMSS